VLQTEVLRGGDKPVLVVRASEGADERV